MSSFRDASRECRRAFTLTEMLVVMAVITILLGISLPALTGIRDNSRTVSCANNMRQIGMALNTYEKEFRTLPPGDAKGRDASAKWLWATFLLPALDQVSLYRKLDLNKDPFAQRYDDTRSTSDIGAYYPLNVVLPFFICPGGSRAEPSRSDDNRLPVATMGTNIRLGCMDYVGLQGVHPDISNATLDGERYRGNEGMFLSGGTAPQGAGPQEATPRVTFKQVRDGLGKTILLAECTGRAQNISDSVNGPRHGAWAISERSLVTMRRGINPAPDQRDPPKRSTSAEVAWYEDQLYSDHRGGCNVVMCDTSVQFLRDTTPVSVVAALVSKAGTEMLFKDDTGDWDIDPNFYRR